MSLGLFIYFYPLFSLARCHHHHHWAAVAGTSPCFVEITSDAASRGLFYLIELRREKEGRGGAGGVLTCCSNNEC